MTATMGQTTRHVLALMFLATPAFADGHAGGQDRWTGTVDIEIDAAPGARKASGHFHGTVTLDHRLGPRSVGGTATGAMDYFEDDHGGGTRQGSGQATIKVSVSIDQEHSTYSLNVANPSIACTATSPYGPPAKTRCQLGGGVLSGLKLPKGGALAGNQRFEYGVAKVRWSLSGARPPEAEAVLIPEAGYDTWMPTAGANEDAPGNTVAVRVVLQKKDKPEETPKPQGKFKFELVDVSREPGTCLNSPQSNAKTSPDLKIDPKSNSKLNPLGNDGKSAESAESLHESKVTLTSYDYGAYGKVKVTVTLDDGTLLVAHLQDKPDIEILTIPRDENGNHIADAWEKQAGVRGALQLNADDENDPPGDGHKGDGLSLYEEYRGFLQKGAHAQGDPNRKDYFVVDRARPFAENGIALFERISKLKVHRLDVTELSKRVINFNHDQESHRVDQHGVVVTTTTGTFPAAEAQTIGSDKSKLGTPKAFEQVFFPTGNIVNNINMPPAYMDASLAHELLHTCNVYHHGDGDYWDVGWKQELRDGEAVIVERVYEGENAKRHVVATRVVEVRTEDDLPVPASRYQTEFGLCLGIKNGESSGDESCVMRYDAAGAYVSSQDPKRRYVIRDASFGSALCSGRDGKTFNAQGHKPESRFGSATREPPCSEQLCVNDGAGH